MKLRMLTVFLCAAFASRAASDVIVNAPQSRVRDALINSLLGKGYALTNESQHVLEFGGLSTRLPNRKGVRCIIYLHYVVVQQTDGTTRLSGNARVWAQDQPEPENYGQKFADECAAEIKTALEAHSR